jgi:hypothetical protein
MLLAACATNIRSEHAPGAMLTNYQTFRWKMPKTKHRKVKNPILDSGILDERVKHAVINVLLSRGYTQARPGEQPDFIITYHTTSKQTLKSQGFYPDFGFTYGYPFGFGGIFTPFPSYGGENVETQEEAALILDIIDAKSGRLVWRGWQTEALTQGNFSKQQVQQSIRKILKQFPPR